MVPVLCTVTALLVFSWPRDRYGYLNSVEECLLSLGLLIFAGALAIGHYL